jgi:ABC-type multidrug transport system fused ATPase/permease subunit
MYFLYSAPLEICIALTFLTRLLGPSALAGLLILVVLWPLNSLVTRRSIRIQRGVLKAKDRRMAVLAELLGGLKIVKFAGWEDRWIERVMKAREEEMRWMVKSRMNSVLFTLLWALAPVLVALTSFFTFVHFAGGKLDVATAFTALALFGMVRQPLNVVPMYVVQILQTLVAVRRIEGFLGEEEVDGSVSTLKSEVGAEGSEHGRAVERQVDDDDEEGLGFVGASFKWNEVEEEADDSTV